MEPHIHSGFITFATVGVYAILFIQVLRMLAGWLASKPQTEKIGAALGATVHFA